ncbi:hypothetical protein EJ04DRAFT_210937 [Polyplosphaeria fusca]|uniref:Uncharacterized protein n=1 Tax=Polyplosphaeria fusca TaxID=682080 RepID=A0A9P4V5B2_9PLEO|nr:hypothetical protein EJ04DRAFT_210937 [Polyplosphaeria fusca]
MPSQRQTRARKRKRNTENPSATSPGSSGAQDTLSSGYFELLPDIPNDQSSTAPTIPTELDSQILPIPTEHQSNHSGSFQPLPDTSSSPYERRFVHTWVDWNSLPYHTIDASSGIKKAWWWQYGVPLQYKWLQNVVRMRVKFVYILSYIYEED